MLKALAGFLNDRREVLYELSYDTGATRADAMIDVDGGIGTLFVYASKGRRELPDDVLVRRRGGRGALAYGALRRPARGDLAARRRGPHQCLQLPGLGHAGEARPDAARRGAGDRQARLGDRLGGRGLLPADRRVAASCPKAPCSSSPARPATCSTGWVRRTSSPSPARRPPPRMLRDQPNLLRNAVRFIAEQDSLNATVLGPDAAPGTPEFELFVREVHREMTAKAGQKCTAIRRILVPREHRSAAVDAIVAEAGRPRASAIRALRDHAHGRAGEPRPARRRARQGRPHRHRGNARLRRSAALRSRRRRRRHRRLPAAHALCLRRSGRAPRPCTGSRPSARSPPSCPPATSRMRWRSPTAAGARWWHRCSPTTRPSRERPCWPPAPGTAGFTSPTATAGKEATGPRLSVAASGPWRPWPRWRWRGDGRHPRRVALHAAHGGAGQP